MTRFLVLAAALAIGSLGASLAGSAGDPLPSVIRAMDASFSRPVGRASISMDMWQVVGTSGDFVLMRPTFDGVEMCSMLPADWYGVR